MFLFTQCLVHVLAVPSHLPGTTLPSTPQAPVPCLGNASSLLRTWIPGSLLHLPAVWVGRPSSLLPSHLGMSLILHLVASCIMSPHVSVSSGLSTGHKAGTPRTCGIRRSLNKQAPQESQDSPDASPLHTLRNAEEGRKFSKCPNKEGQGSETRSGVPKDGLKYKAAKLQVGCFAVKSGWANPPAE